MRTSALSIACGVLLTCGVAAHASGDREPARVDVRREASTVLNDRDRGRVKPFPAPPTLQIRNVRLEDAPDAESAPSTVLKFDMSNEGSQRFTDVLLEIAILEKPHASGRSQAQRVIVGPFTIRGNVTIESGYTVQYEMLLRNLSSDCGCTANVRVVSARPLLDATSGNHASSRPSDIAPL